MKILIVEDNAKMRATIRNILESNIEIIDQIYECEAGDKAVELYQKKQPDWVLMDIHLKNGDGLTAAQQITENYSPTRIIIIAQYDDPIYRKSACRIGAYDYILKDNIHDLPKVILSGHMIFLK